MHSFVCPSLGIKCDAYLRRLNQVSVMNQRQIVFYGQCSEMCDVFRSRMLIVTESISVNKFVG